MKVSVNTKWQRKFERDNPDFYGFHNAFDNVDISPDQLMQHIKLGHSYCAQHKHIRHPYEADDGAIRYTAFRCQQNWLPTSVISLDFDTGDIYSSFPHLLESEIIRRYAAFLYSTTSSTPDKPRTRVVFVTDKPVQSPINYHDALCALSATFTRNDRSAKDIAKPYAGNVNAVFQEIGNVLPVKSLALMVYNWKEREAEEERQRRVYFDSLPKTFTYDQVVEMLRHVPSFGLDYIGWVKILMAVHDAVPGEAGVDLCESWCPGTKNEIAMKFRSFRKTEVTVAYLRSQAMRHGWLPATESRETRVNMALRMMATSRRRT